MIKGITLLLIVLAVLAMFGRLRLQWPGRKKPPLLAAKCPRCGRPRIGKGNCECGAPPPKV